jgi:hypothetical protein
MPNDLASLAGIGFKAAQEVRLEIVGLMNACSHDFSLEGAALNEDVLVPIVGAAGNNTDFVPGVDAGQGDDTTVTTTKIRISKIRKNTFHLKGEDMPYINRVGFEAWFAMRLKQSMRKLVNEAEIDLCIEAMNGAGWAVGQAGVVPFATDHTILNAALRIMEENGVPQDDLSCVISTTYAEKVRNLSYLWKMNETGDQGDLLRRGILGELSNFKFRKSAFIQTHTKGTVSAVTTTGAAAGALLLPVSGGTFTQGDLVSIAGITDRKYVASGPVSGGNLPLNGELNKAAVATSGVTIEAANHVANICLHRRGLALALRTPIMPPGGDKADEVFDYGDERSGLSFQVAKYKQYGQASYEVRIATGRKVLEPACIGVLAA